jgi:hypothetical protein
MISQDEAEANRNGLRVPEAFLPDTDAGEPKAPKGGGRAAGFPSHIPSLQPPPLWGQGVPIM